MILHITNKLTWEQSQKVGKYEGDTLLSEGFIHCSTEEQLIEVANFIFKSQHNLVLLVIDQDKVKAEIKYEDAGNKKLYPHIYGPLNLDAVVNVVDFFPMRMVRLRCQKSSNIVPYCKHFAEIN